MKSKWSEIQSLVGDRRQKLDRAMKTKRVGDQLKSLDDTLLSFKRWLDNVEEIGGENETDDAAKISLQLDQCKVKLKSLRSNDDKVAALFADAGSAFSSSSSSPAEDASGLQEELVSFKARWDSTVEKIEDRRRLLLMAVEQTPPKKFLEAMTSLLSWINGAESELLVDKFLIRDLDAMEDERAKFAETQKSVVDLQKSFEYIQKTGAELIAKSSGRDKVGIE